MQIQLKMQILNYFLSSGGIQFFQSWYISKSILEPIWKDLNGYTQMLLSIPWADKQQRDNIRTLIRTNIELLLESTFNKSTNDIYQSWINDTNKYCYQGGYGFSFTYPDAPHHWVIRIECINQVTPIPEEVQIAACILDKYLIISDTPAWEIWSN